MPDTIDLSLLGKRVLETNALVTELKAEVAEMGRGFVMLSEKLRRHIAEVKDDVELLVKSELMGAIANLETRMEARLEDHSSRMEDKFDQLLHALGHAPMQP